MAPHAVPGRFFGLIGSAVMVGSLLGVLEGAIYPHADGPRIAIGVYWGLLAVVLVLALFALARVFEPRAWPAFGLAVILLPLTVVVQDALSLVLQGSTPFVADWYGHFFGVNLLTQRGWGGLPGFYGLFTVFSTGLVALALVTPIALASRRRRAHRRAQSRWG